MKLLKYDKTSHNSIKFVKYEFKNKRVACKILHTTLSVSGYIIMNYEYIQNM